MKRRNFLGKSCCGLAVLAAVPVMLDKESGAAQQMKRYKIEIEIFEAKERACGRHRQGQIFQYPDDIDKICPWFLSSMHDFIRILEFGGTLGWTYRDSPYEKIINKDGITTEFVRCPDPVANLCAKIIRTEVG